MDFLECVKLRGNHAVLESQGMILFPPIRLGWGLAVLSLVQEPGGDRFSKNFLNTSV